MSDAGTPDRFSQISQTVQSAYHEAYADGIELEKRVEILRKAVGDLVSEHELSHPSAFAVVVNFSDDAYTHQLFQTIEPGDCHD